MSANITPYRTPAEIVPFLKEEYKGPRDDCPLCGTVRVGSSYSARYTVNRIRACSGRNWLFRLFGACGRKDLHLHQWCEKCKARWMCAAKEWP